MGQFGLRDTDRRARPGPRSDPSLRATITLGKDILTSFDLRLCGVSESFIVFPPLRKSSKSRSSSALSSMISSSYDCVDDFPSR